MYLQFHCVLVESGNEGDGRHEDGVEAERLAQRQAQFVKARYHERDDGAEPLDREHGRGENARPGMYRVQVTLVELVARWPSFHVLVHVHGTQSQRRNYVRERVQHYVRQRHFRLVAFYHENRCENLSKKIVPRLKYVLRRNIPAPPRNRLKIMDTRAMGKTITGTFIGIFQKLHL